MLPRLRLELRAPALRPPTRIRYKSSAHPARIPSHQLGVIVIVIVPPDSASSHLPSAFVFVLVRVSTTSTTYPPPPCTSHSPPCPAHALNTDSHADTLRSTQCPRCGRARSWAGVAQRGASAASHPAPCSLTPKPHRVPPSVLHTLRGRARAQPENAQTATMPSTAPLLPRRTMPDSDLPLLVAAVPAAMRKLRVIFTRYEGERQGHDPSWRAYGNALAQMHVTPELDHAHVSPLHPRGSRTRSVRRGARSRHLSFTRHEEDEKTVDSTTRRARRRPA
ncbi:hypothetical protein B0H13DRAFT_1065050 [Mycena leptocephala]|nr:hypothetical protein B0H13DRAFT_1065050 [Mycena leptocephala]